MPTALITGATGLLGSHVAERMLADGWQVRAMVRDVGSADARWLSDRGVELVRGDVLDAESFARAARGQEVMVHAAAAVLAKGGWEEFRTTNIEGTRIAIDAAADAGARMVMVSSVAVYGPDARYSGTGPTDEETPLTPLPERGLYARSKRDSEALVLAAHAQGRLWATAVRPDVIYGPRDRAFVPKIGGLVSKGVAPLLGGGRSVMPIVHAANVADGIVRAAVTSQAGGKAYNLANDFDTTAREFFELAAQGMGKRLRFIPLPVSLVRAGMGALSVVSDLLLGGRFSAVGAQTVDFLSRDNPFSSERARRELGWDPPVRPCEAIPEAFRWWANERRARH
ncbi:MAG: nucleoside-diphosphate-sugar epimerase [Gemmatimonadetes bacterium]|nr:nucleoside-diphosphate-sugar epimerase [Gemmatimonadota bacterium]